LISGSERSVAMELDLACDGCHEVHEVRAGRAMIRSYPGSDDSLACVRDCVPTMLRVASRGARFSRRRQRLGRFGCAARAHTSIDTRAPEMREKKERCQQAPQTHVLVHGLALHRLAREGLGSDFARVLPARPGLG